MKTKRTTHQPESELPAQTVRVKFIHQMATKVCIVGAFNDWRPEVTPMISLGDGRWIKELVLPPGVYEYQWVVDGKWMPHPPASKTTANRLGRVNSTTKTKP